MFGMLHLGNAVMLSSTTWNIEPPFPSLRPKQCTGLWEHTVTSRQCWKKAVSLWFISRKFGRKSFFVVAWILWNCFKSEIINWSPIFHYSFWRPTPKKRQHFPLGFEESTLLRELSSMVQEDTIPFPLLIEETICILQAFNPHDLEMISNCCLVML